jgi:tRNA G18 (ribose-2'-O)-methylase SpoU
MEPSSLEVATRDQLCAINDSTVRQLSASGMRRAVARTVYLDDVFVDGVSDPALADYRALTDVELRRRSEPAHGIFIAEGGLVIRRALRAGYPMRSALMTQRWLPSVEGLVPDADVPLYVGSDELLESVTGFHVHRGALAAMGRLPLKSVAELLPGTSRLVILEEVNSHTNLGAIFRSAAGLGMDAVLLSPTCADPLYRRSVRVSMGEVFSIPYARFESWPGGLANLRDAGFRVLALTPDPGASSIDDIEVADVVKLAWLLGAEGAGLSAHALDAATAAVRIPMGNSVDSLNVAAAAAVACYAIRRRP